MDAAATAVGEALLAKAVEVKTRKDIAHVATISAQDETIGDLIAGAMEQVGRDGVITVEEGSALAVRPGQRDEPAQRETVAAQHAVGLVGERGAAGLAPPAQRDDEPPAGRELRGPRRRDVPRASGDHDPVEHPVSGRAVLPVTGQQR
jgi:hypothetical protein